MVGPVPLVTVVRFLRPLFQFEQSGQLAPAQSNRKKFAHKAL